MSKAFTRESDAEDDFTPPRAPLPAGTKNYITKAGAEKIHRELNELIEHKRAVDEAVSESGKKPFEARVQYLQALVNSFVVVDASPSDVVRFGARVTVRRGPDEESYTIVGVDEIDLDQNHISWLSPLARALMGRRVGDRVPFKSPAGSDQIEILSIE